MRFEWDKKHIGFRVMFDRPRTRKNLNGVEFLLWPRQGLPWWNLLLPYVYSVSPEGKYRFHNLWFGQRNRAAKP